MENEKYFLGIDGGGTKTIAVVCNEHGEIKARARGDSINYNAVGFKRAQENMKKIIDILLQKLHIESFTCACVGMSAIGERASQAETDAFCQAVIPCEKVVMDSDLAIAMESMLCKGACAVVISGTGSMAVGRKPDGTIIHTGGWGYILGDEGSGYALSLDALRAGICGYEGSGEKTLLTEKMVDFYKAEDIWNLIDVFYDPPMERSEIAKFTSVLFACTRAGDAVANRIVCRQAERLADTACALLSRLPESIDIGVWGGIFTNCPEYLNLFAQQIQKKHGSHQVNVLAYPPEIGALFYAMRETGMEIDEEIQLNVKRGMDDE